MTDDQIKRLALANGFRLRPQSDGSIDLNEYVYAFAREVFEAGQKAERAKREKQEPIAWYCDGEDGREYNGCPQMSNGRTGIPLYAAPPVTAPVRLTDMQVVKLFQDFNERDGASHADLIQSTEAAVLRANGFDIQPAEGN